MSTPASQYIMGHTDHERRRLSLQAGFLNPLTEGFLRRAGIAPGMRVLDLGCGVGEVSLIAARLVGSTGHVTAIDIDAAALEIARAAAATEGIGNIAFTQANVADYSPDTPFDLVTGRLILIHTSEPAAVVRRAVSFLLPGGIAAFQDYDFTQYILASPPRPLWDRIIRIVYDFVAKAAPHGNAGSQLYRLLHDAGISALECRGETAMDSDPDTLIYDWVCETLRTLLPGMIATGIVAEGDFSPDTLPHSLREEGRQIGGIIGGPMLLGVFGRK